MEGRGWRPSEVGCRGALEAFHANKRAEGARELLERLRAKGVVLDAGCYALVLDGLIHRWQAALQLLRVIEVGRDTAPPLVSTMPPGWPATSCVSIRRVRLWRICPQETGPRPDEACYVAVAKACAKGGRCDETLEVLRAFKARKDLVVDVHAYEAAMSACFRAGRPESVVELMEELENDGLVASQDTYVTLLQALMQLGRWREGVEALQRGRQLGALDAEALHSAADKALIKFCRAGQWREALPLLRLSVGVSPSGPNRSVLPMALESLCVAGEWEGAVRLLEALHKETNAPIGQ
jgi:pentatricopeptide repeat protein